MDNGMANSELMLYNPMKTPIEVVFRRWYLQEKDAPPRVYTESDVLLRVNRIKPDDYVLFATAAAEIRATRAGLMEVLVNGKSAGIYGMMEQIEAPTAKIMNGIIIKQRSNAGGTLQYEIIYETLNFKKNSNPKARVEYLKHDFYLSGFMKGEKFNPDDIGLVDISVNNLLAESNAEFDLKLVSTGKTGSFEVTFKNRHPRARISQRNFHHMIDHGTGQAIAFNIPCNISFKKKAKYKIRK